jgi:hypothetical protein
MFFGVAVVPQQKNFVIMFTFATTGQAARVGGGVRDHSYE